MKKALTELDQRNRLLVWIIWGLLALGVITDIGIGLPFHLIILLISVGGIFSAAATAMTYTPRLSPYVKYIVPFGLTSIVSVLILSDPEPIVSTYFLVYVNMAIVALYSDYRPIVLTGVLGAIMTTYIYNDSIIRERMFPHDSLMYLYLYLVFVTVALCVSAYFAQSWQRNMKERQLEALAAKELSEGLIQKLQQSIAILNEFSAKQKGQVQAATRITHEVTSTFNEMTAAVEQQTNHIVVINDSTQAMSGNVMDMTESIQQLENVADKNTKLSERNVQQLHQMSEEMNMLRQSTAQALEEMERLKMSNEHVRDIATTINGIASQIHLLALNAAIEAARAGEHGRGFAVVSGEVSKLAEHTRDSVEQISELLGGIHHNITAAYKYVDSGNQSVIRSSAALQQTSEAIVEAEANTKLASTQTMKAASSTESLMQQSVMLAERMNDITGTTQQNMSAVQEVNANMDLQYNQMLEMSQQFEQLDALITELNMLIDKRK